jgi:hypothetical protein
MYYPNLTSKVATNFFYVFNMSATMAKHGGRVQLDQSNMRLALNMAKMATEVFSQAAIEETQQLIKQPCAKVRELKKRGVEFPGHNMVNAAIKRHPAMVRENHMDSCLPCRNGTTKNPQTCWKRKGTGALLPRQAPAQPRMPPVPAGDEESSEIEGMTPGYVYIHTPLPSA